MQYAMGYDLDGEPILHMGSCSDINRRNLKMNTVDYFEAADDDAALSGAADIHSADLDCFDGEFASVEEARPTARGYIVVKPCAKKN